MINKAEPAAEARKTNEDRECNEFFRSRNWVDIALTEIE